MCSYIIFFQLAHIYFQEQMLLKWEHCRALALTATKAVQTKMYMPIL
uniref:Uncharacterized protein n=1 Tax=Anguilla anguilla TaxID=7936 RepID=A0A0E9XM96_ANGAN